MPDTNEYIHPDSSEIGCFIRELQPEGLPISGVVGKLFRWFDDNVSYSRLNAPYRPLQRSDLDVLQMRSGTCGDYSNLLVSVLTRLGYRAKYARVRVDCYGAPQDHICAAVWNGERWQLLDAALPYRKWHGLDCPHREYELLSCDAMRSRLKQEEQYWTDKAKAWKEPSFAGLLYAPWIHEEVVLCTEDRLETVFFLLIADSVEAYTVSVYDLVYTETVATCAILCRITGDGLRYSFPVRCAEDLWDEKQWGEAYAEADIPERYRSDRLTKMTETIKRILPRIRTIMDPKEYRGK